MFLVEDNLMLQLNLMKKFNKEYLLLSIILSLFFIIFSTISLHRYWQYSTWYYDFGIFYSAISAVSQAREPIIDHYVFTDQNILGDHFHPIIFLISPLLLIFKGGETLLIAQTLFVTLSGIFIYLIAKEIFKNSIESFSMLIIYLSFIGLHNALITEFHEIALLPLPLTMFFYGMVKKKISFYSIGLLGTLLTKETLFFIPLWFGFLIFLKNKDLWRKIGLATILISSLYAIIIIKFIIPLFNGQGYYYLDNTITANKTYILDNLSIKSIFKTFTSFGFLPLLSPETLIPVLFNWLMRISRFGNFDLGMHYNAEIAPTLALSSIYGWKRLKMISPKRINYNIIIVLLAIFSYLYSSQVLKSPILLFTNNGFYQNTKNFAFLNKLIEQIPNDGIVMAQTNIASKIANRKHVYMLRDDYYNFDPDYIVFDKRDGQEPNNFFDLKDFYQTVSKIENDPNYEIFYDQGEQFIYKKTTYPK